MISKSASVLEEEAGRGRFHVFRPAGTGGKASSVPTRCCREVSGWPELHLTRVSGRLEDSGPAPAAASLPSRPHQSPFISLFSSLFRLEAFAIVCLCFQLLLRIVHHGELSTSCPVSSCIQHPQLTPSLDLSLRHQYGFLSFLYILLFLSVQC